PSCRARAQRPGGCRAARILPGSAPAPHRPAAPTRRSRSSSRSHTRTPARAASLPSSQHLDGEAYRNDGSGAIAPAALSCAAEVRMRASLVVVACALASAIAPSAGAQAPVDRFVDAGGRRIHYLEWGRSELPPFVMIHGIAR